MPTIIVKSGLGVDTANDEWILLPYNGKGWKISVAWVRSEQICLEHQKLIFQVIIFYARTMAASTTSGVVTNIRPYLVSGILGMTSLIAMWSGLATNNKKGLNQFFGTLVRLGHLEFSELHIFTSANLDKECSNALDPSSGALTDIEFDSFARQVNRDVQAIDWGISRSLKFYMSKNLFGSVRNSISNKLLLAIVRRPIQLTVLKWCDLIPSGSTFADNKVLPGNEVGTLGGDTLQLRVFTAKSQELSRLRGDPERYPLHVSESLSKTFVEYKRMIANGLALIFSNRAELEELDILSAMDDFPIFPDCKLFNLRFNSLSEFRALFSPGSIAYHCAEGTITMAVRGVPVMSDRISDCIVTSNRIRHTVLTRAAQDGLPAHHLAKITGVTVPAARHYVDLNYKSRRLIDVKFLGNKLLKAAFNDVIKAVPCASSQVLDDGFNVVGGTRQDNVCSSCPTMLSRPLSCYGCTNFRPLLEADHNAVLAKAQSKLEANKKSYLSSINPRSLERLETQIAWVQLTIEVCREVLGEGRLLDK
jgi:hypothetical protein